MLDKIDKEILRLLLKYKEQTLTTNQISKKLSIAPRTAKKHLEKLEKEGYVFWKETGKRRDYETKEIKENAKNKKINKN